MTNIHPIFAAALAPFAPPLSELSRQRADIEMTRAKQAGDDENNAIALTMQINRATYKDHFEEQK
jgi:hypothetical protein